MRSVREWMARTYIRVTGTASGPVALDIDKAARHFYAVAVVFCLALSLVLFWLLPKAFVSVGFAILWGVFLGLTCLYLMPPKLVTSIFGALFGAGGSDLAAAAGVITIANERLRAVFKAMFQSDTYFSSSAIWIFVIIVAIFCFYPFLKEEGAKSGKG